MLKKALLFIFLILIAILLFGCTARVGGNTYKAGSEGAVFSQWPPKDVSECKAYDELGTDSKHKRSECYSYLAIQNNDKSVCDAPDLIAQWSCIRAYAKAKNDVSACEDIGDNVTETYGGFFGINTYKSIDLCYFDLSSDKNNYCARISDLNVKAYCANLYDKSICYSIEDLPLRGSCFGMYVPLSGGKYEFEGAKCPEKINAFESSGEIAKPNYNDRNIPDILQTALNRCIEQKAIDEANPDLCKILDKASTDVADMCYFVVGQYFQIDLCDRLKPSCSYDGKAFDWGIDWGNPNSFGKEYCKKAVNKYKPDSTIKDSYWVTDLGDITLCTAFSQTGQSMVNSSFDSASATQSKLCGIFYVGGKYAAVEALDNNYRIEEFLYDNGLSVEGRRLILYKQLMEKPEYSQALSFWVNKDKISVVYMAVTNPKIDGNTITNFSKIEEIDLMKLAQYNCPLSPGASAAEPPPAANYPPSQNYQPPQNYQTELSSNAHLEVIDDPSGFDNTSTLGFKLYDETGALVDASQKIVEMTGTYYSSNPSSSFPFIEIEGRQYPPLDNLYGYEGGNWDVIVKVSGYSDTHIKFTTENKKLYVVTINLHKI